MKEPPGRCVGYVVHQAINDFDLPKADPHASDCAGPHRDPAWVCRSPRLHNHAPRRRALYRGARSPLATSANNSGWARRDAAEYLATPWPGAFALLPLDTRYVLFPILGPLLGREAESGRIVVLKIGIVAEGQ